jgi:transposase/IS5 family transposase
MTMGKSEAHDDLFRSVRELCDGAVGERSIYRMLAEQSHLLFPDEMFADLYSSRGRRSVAPRVMATVMVLQRFDGLSDSEAVDRLHFDLRYKCAAGLAYDAPSFDSTLLVDMRARLRNSAAPDRIFEAVLDVAKKANLVGKKRIVDSTALYDAVATQDTVTLVRSAIVGVLRVVDAETAMGLRKLLKRDDPYDKSGKPSCAWDDAKAREELVDALTRDANAILLALHGQGLTPDMAKATTLLATVVGQDIEEGTDGVFRIVRGVAPDRVISTVDPEGRHGHKTAARGFDGYKGHIAVDAESEIITATQVTAGNAGDASAAEELLADVLTATDKSASTEAADDKRVVYGDASYGTAELVEKLEGAGVEPNVKVQPPSAREGMFSQDDFEIDTKGAEVCCPAGLRVALRVLKDGSGMAEFGGNCADCPLRSQCTESKAGRTIKVHPKHETLARHRKRQRDDAWKKQYRKVRPRVERKIGHLMRRKHGGRRARVRGCERVGQDFALLAASINLARLAALGVRIAPTITAP